MSLLNAVEARFFPLLLVGKDIAFMPVVPFFLFNLSHSFLFVKFFVIIDI